MMTFKEYDNPVISVIIPARKCKDDLRECLDCLSKSQFKDFEVIVVDDASPDDTTTWINFPGVQVLVLPEQSGPAAARNLGAQVARGELLLFLDADVCVHTETIGRVVETLHENPCAAGVFGSYDTTPYAQNVLSQYRNLMHHYVHQDSQSEATTFWSGCGAIRRNVFLNAGGFHPDYRRPCIEDIELGVRMHKAGHTILLNKEILVTHRKCWSLWGMIKTDVRDRALPWSQLILKEGKLPNDLNLTLAHRISALLAGILLLVLIVAAWWLQWVILLPIAIVGAIAVLDTWSQTRRIPTSWRVLGVVAVLVVIGVLAWQIKLLVLLPIALVSAIVMLNWPFYSFLSKVRHPLFAALAVPLQILYYLYSAGGFACAYLTHLLGLGPTTKLPAPVLMSSPLSIYRRFDSQREMQPWTHRNSTSP